MVIAEDKNLKIIKLVLGPYETNAYIVVCKATKESIVVDAPAGADEIIKNLEGTKAKIIFLTHDHYDHTDDIDALRGRLKAPLATHELSSSQLKTPPEILLSGGDVLKLGKLKIEVLFTPGHTPGSLCLKTGKFLFAGDALFPGGPGHTETPEDFKTIIKSITGNIYKLPDETLVLPGHGDGITIGESKKEYAIFAVKNHDGAYGDVTWVS